jgi:hypothetical protein
MQALIIQALLTDKERETFYANMDKQLRAQRHEQGEFSDGNNG